MGIEHADRRKYGQDAAQNHDALSAQKVSSGAAWYFTEKTCDMEYTFGNADLHQVLTAVYHEQYPDGLGYAEVSEKTEEIVEGDVFHIISGICFYFQI